MYSTMAMGKSRVERRIGTLPVQNIYVHSTPDNYDPQATCRDWTSPDSREAAKLDATPTSPYAHGRDTNLVGGRTYILRDEGQRAGDVQRVFVASCRPARAVGRREGEGFPSAGLASFGTFSSFPASVYSVQVRCAYQTCSRAPTLAVVLQACVLVVPGSVVEVKANILTATRALTVLRDRACTGKCLPMTLMTLPA
ncbi:hypothetical protein BC628DRAFT_50369 [Trametes gibbosa]|nr:hypothetical protein BC628DRAFT_50369 [Trametes gibbosa]